MKKSMWVFFHIKYSKFWSILLDHFIKSKPLLSEECCVVVLLYMEQELSKKLSTCQKLIEIWNWRDYDTNVKGFFQRYFLSYCCCCPKLEHFISEDLQSKKIKLVFWNIVIGKESEANIFDTSKLKKVTIQKWIFVFSRKSHILPTS